MTSNMDDQHLAWGSNNTKTQEGSNKSHSTKEAVPGNELWTDGLLCAVELVRRHRKPKPQKSRPTTEHMQENESFYTKKQLSENGNFNPMYADEKSEQGYPFLTEFSDAYAFDSSQLVAHYKDKEKTTYTTNFVDHKWIPIGWSRILELVQRVQSESSWDYQQIDYPDGEDDYTVADVAAPYWERPAGPSWWCHVTAGYPFVDSWLNSAHWLHPAIRTALRDESRLISDRMKHLLYEVPVRVAGGLLFELLGQSAGDPYRQEDDIPIVLRSWQAQNFLVTAMHVKGSAPYLNVLGITEVQELLLAGGIQAPRTVHELIAHLACRLSRWDDRLFRKYVFGEADEVELKFVNRRNCEDLNLLSIILNQEIRRLASQVIRVKWLLHAREEIVIELLRYLRGNATRSILERIKASTREMLEEQEAVRGRLFTIQDVMQSTVRAWLQDRSLRITHNLTIFGGCGLVLSIITGLFGINVDGIPGANNTPYAFGLFAALLVLLGLILIGVGMLYLGLTNPITDEKVKVRKMELEDLVMTFQHDAETHAKVREGINRPGLSPTSSAISVSGYILIP